jgi:hypothetical protein
MMSNYEQFDKITAKLIPRNLTTLREEMKPFIGKTYEWEAIWVQEDDAPFAGQMVFRVAGFPVPFHYWVPEEDLELAAFEQIESATPLPS